jgi:hypothetical protein
MDIVVTIPKSEYQNDERENKFMQESTDVIQFWKFSKLPKNIKVGDRIYFVKNNRIPYSMRIREISKNDWEQCTTTGRVWEGNLIFIDDLRVEEIDIPCRGFQGFRYKWWED